MADPISDIGGGTLSGAATGAALGTAVPVVGNVIGAAVGAGVGLLAGLGKFFWGRSQAKKQKKEAEKVAREQEQRHQEYIERAEGRSKDLYEQYKFDPTAIKEQYSASVQRALQEQAEGTYAALASQSSVNPAMAAQALSAQQARAQASAAGETALQQEKLGTQFDLYNKQLMQQLRQQELAYEGKEEERLFDLAKQEFALESQMRQQQLQDLFGGIAKSAEAGVALGALGGRAAKPQSLAATPAPSRMGSPYSLFPEDQEFTKYKNTFNPTLGGLG